MFFDIEVKENGKGMTYQGLLKHTNLAEAFLSRIHSDGEIIFMDRKGKYTNYTYEYLWKRSLVYAKYLKDQGIEKGDIVTLILPSCPEFIMIFMACQITGAVPVSLYPMMSLGDIDGWKERTMKMISQVKCKHFFGTHVLKMLLFENLDELGIQAHDVEKINQKSEELEYATELFPSSEDLCFLQFSSGTTSDPKPVMITQKNALINAQLMNDTIELPMEKTKAVTWLPLYHDMGLVGTFIGSIIGAQTLTIIRPDDFIRKPALWVKALSEQKANITVAPNFAYGLCVKRINEKQMQGLDLSHVHLAGCGAEAVYKETMDKFLNKFGKVGFQTKAIVPMYGMAEATLAVSSSRYDEEIQWKCFDEELLAEGMVFETNEKQGKYLCSLGKPLPTYKVEVRDKEGNILPEKHVGRLYIQGPSVFGGYYKDQLKTEKAFSKGMLDTGDEGFIYDGEIYIAGRAKDTMIIRGKNYYPTIFEESLTVIRALREGRVVVASSYFKESDTEEMVILAEVKNEKYLEDTTELKQLVTNIISASGDITPKQIEFLAPGILPRTSSGKLKRAAAVAMWKNGTLTGKPKTGFRDRTKVLGAVVKNTFSNAVNTAVKRLRTP